MLFFCSICLSLAFVENPVLLVSEMRRFQGNLGICLTGHWVVLSEKAPSFLTVFVQIAFDFWDLDSIAAMTPQMIEIGHRTKAARPAVRGTRMTAQMVRKIPPPIVA
jgi:hypothetical protein